MEDLSMFLGRFDWANLSAIVAIAGGLYRFIHKDFEVMGIKFDKDIQMLKENQNSFREEMKEIKEKSRLTDLRIDGIYTILMKKYGEEDKK
jgi:hypothetical protein